MMTKTDTHLDRMTDIGLTDMKGRIGNIYEDRYARSPDRKENVEKRVEKKEAEMKNPDNKSEASPTCFKCGKKVILQ